MQGNLLQLALRRHRIVGLRRRADQDETDIVAGDQFLGYFGGTVRIGLAILFDHLDLVRLRSELETVFGRCPELTENKIVSFGKCGQRTALWRHITDLDDFRGEYRRAEQRRRPKSGDCAGGAPKNLTAIEPSKCRLHFSLRLVVGWTTPFTRLPRRRPRAWIGACGRAAGRTPRRASRTRRRRHCWRARR